MKPWQCFAICWSCRAEVSSQGATRNEVERPIHWFCPECNLRWSAYADRVEVSTQVMAS